MGRGGQRGHGSLAYGTCATGAALSDRVTSRMQHFRWDRGLARVGGDSIQTLRSGVCILVGSRVRFMGVPTFLAQSAVHVHSVRLLLKFLIKMLDVFFEYQITTRCTRQARASRFRSPGIVRGAGIRRHSSLRQCACAYRLAVQQPRQGVIAPSGATRGVLPPRRIPRPLSPRG